MSLQFESGFNSKSAWLWIQRYVILIKCELSKKMIPKYWKDNAVVKKSARREMQHKPEVIKTSVVTARRSESCCLKGGSKQ